MTDRGIQGGVNQTDNSNGLTLSEMEIRKIRDLYYTYDCNNSVTAYLFNKFNPGREIRTTTVRKVIRRPRFDDDDLLCMLLFVLLLLGSCAILLYIEGPKWFQRLTNQFFGYFN